MLYPRSHPAPMETCGCVADVDRVSGKLTLWSTTQAPHAHRTVYALVAGLPEHKIRIIAPDIGASRRARNFAEDLDLPLADFARLATWVDASGVYYGSYWGRIHIEHKNHPNFRPVPTFEEALSTVCPTPDDKR